MTHFLTTLALAIVIAVFGVSAAGAQSFRAELSSKKVAYRSTEGIELSLKIRNLSSGELALLSWKLPFAGIEDDIFVVRCGGKRVRYIGRLYKRAAPTEEDWVRIPPGQEVSGSFDLGDSYELDEGGECTIQFRFELTNVNAKGRDTLPGTVASEPLFMILDPRPAPKGASADGSVVALPEDVPGSPLGGRPGTEAPQPPPLEPLPDELIELTEAQLLAPSPEEEAAAAADFLLLSEGASVAESVEELEEDFTEIQSLALTATYRNCSATRQSLLKTALASAQSYATGAYNFLTSNPVSTSRYTRWFGRFTTARYGLVKANFSRIRTAMASKRFTFDCGCSKRGAFAYVYPTRPYQVWLCPVFWQAPNTGRDSKAGTLVHETSHFDIIANTNDYVYGASNARWLALYYPSYAVRNADNYAYFVELK